MRKQKVSSGGGGGGGGSPGPKCWRLFFSKVESGSVHVQVFLRKPRRAPSETHRFVNRQ